MRTLILALLATTTLSGTRYDMYSGAGVYDVWSPSGLHLAMCDNGTPDDFDDDWVIDWETNREIVVMVLDK